MLDFSSALYLGFRHESCSLQPWSNLTKGKPAALSAPDGEQVTAQRLAKLQGCEDGLLAPSTLHLFWDLFGILSKYNLAIYVDAGAYPIARWCVIRAAANGIPVQSFPHHDAYMLQQKLRHGIPHNARPVIVFDGFCPGCGKPAPVAEYLEITRAFGGYLVIDDTQALGILGHSPDHIHPYGIGGGGLLRWSSIQGPEILMVSSLSKGFGVPVAVLAGSKSIISLFKANSGTRVHCSPPSVAVINAAWRALGINSKRGDSIRSRLLRLVRRFRAKLANSRLSAIGWLFPVQTIRIPYRHDPELIHHELLMAGIQTVLRHSPVDHKLLVSFIITALHNDSDIDYAANILIQVMEQFSSKHYETVDLRIQ